ncbi:hypothetical protein [Staphylococcus equorum]|uniref:hypothetical protein n=1 Tax=Staphylococcus equorum TaxID=246432 RepID=UPI00397F5FF2
MKKLKKHLAKNNYEYIVKKDEVTIYHDDLIVKIWYEQEFKEFFILTFNNEQSVLIDNYTNAYYKKNVKKTIKQLNKLVAV